MFKLTLTVIFLCMMAVNGKIINCHTCIESPEYFKIQVIYSLTSPYGQSYEHPSTRLLLPDCSSLTLGLNKTELVDSSKYSCYKLKLAGLGKVEYFGLKRVYNADYVQRFIMEKGKCQTLELTLNEFYRSASCYECDEDKCNGGSLTRTSILIMLASVVLSIFVGF